MVSRPCLSFSRLALPPFAGGWCWWWWWCLAATALYSCCLIYGISFSRQNKSNLMFCCSIWYDFRIQTNGNINSMDGVRCRPPNGNNIIHRRRHTADIRRIVADCSWLFIQRIYCKLNWNWIAFKKLFLFTIWLCFDGGFALLGCGKMGSIVILN